MRLPSTRRCAVALLLSQFASLGDCVEVRALGHGRLAVRDGADPPIPTSAEITEKWDKMDEFLKIMFTMACTWKHGKDVHGAAAEKLKSSGKKEEAMSGFKADIQKSNLQQLKGACGMIVASGQKKCRQACADRWGEAMKDRSECDGKCVSAFTKFERRCTSKAQDLEKVYSMKLKMGESRQRCYDTHCKDYPMVWMKADDAEMKTALTDACAKQCTPEQVQMRCERKWQLEVDFLRAGVRSKCQDESKVQTCFSDKKATVSADFDKCMADGKGTCGTQHDECKTKGNTAASAKEAEEFCTSRNKLCLEQVDKDCLATNKKALETAQTDCEKESATTFDKCEEDTLAAKETEAVTTCKGEGAKTCPEDCKAKCKVDEMSGCLGALEGQSDPAEAFCEDFWRLLHESSEVDPMSGHPIVLLSSA